MSTLKAYIGSKVRRWLHIDQLIDDQARLIENESFLKTVSYVVHVGANIGQEADFYDRFGLRVLWIEPIPSVFEELVNNTRGYARQSCRQELCTDKDNQPHTLHIASNNGASSSILELKEHKEIWPDVHYVDSINLQSKTLNSILNEENLDLNGLGALVMDTQGSELLVLKGALAILDRFKFIKTEVADFESYSGCCTLDEIDKFMIENGFQRYSCSRFARRSSGGSYYDIVYKNTRSL